MVEDWLWNDVVLSTLGRLVTVLSSNSRRNFTTFLLEPSSYILLVFTVGRRVFVEPRVLVE